VEHCREFSKERDEVERDYAYAVNSEVSAALSLRFLQADTW